MKKNLLALSLIGMTAIASAAPETYELEPNHTKPRFSYNHLGYSTQQSRFDNASGVIVIDKVAKTGTVNVTIDMTSVSTGSTLFNEHIQAPDLFDTAKFPEATFVSNKVHFDGDKLKSVDGALTIKGITKPVTLNISSFHCMPHPMKKKPACGANASVTVKRSDFNMGKHVPYVSDEVTIDIPVEAIEK